MSKHKLNYSKADFNLTPAELAIKYGTNGQHPSFQRMEYTTYAAMPTRDVKLGYWEWVKLQIQKDAEKLTSTAPAPSPEAFQNQLDEVPEIQDVEDLDLVDIESIDQFAEMVAFWHKGVVDRLRHFMTMPEGQTATMSINGKEETVELSGAAYKGFQAAMLTAILQFEQLPFSVTVSSVDPASLMPEADASAKKH